MKKILGLLLALCISVSVFLTACAQNGKQENGQESKAPISSSASETPTVPESSVQQSKQESDVTEMEITTKMVEIRLGGTSYSQPFFAERFVNLEELSAFYEKEKESMAFEGDFAMPGFKEQYEKYDAAYFEKNDLIIVFASETSGSIKHEVKNLKIDGSVLQLTMQRNGIKDGDFGTMDMANWGIFVEFEKQNNAESLNLEMVERK